MLRSLCRLLTLICPLVLASPGSAHHLWVIPQDHFYIVARGLIPDRLDDYEPTCITSIEAYAANGDKLAVQRTDEQRRVRFSTAVEPAVVTISADWGDRVNTPEGKRFLNKKQAVARGLEVESAFNSRQTAIIHLKPVQNWPFPVNMVFEILALRDPLTRGPGENLPIRILFNNVPLPNCPVGYGMKRQAAETDEQGIAHLNLESPGRQIIMATHRVAVGDETIDYRQHMSFLSFVRP